MTDEEIMQSIQQQPQEPQEAATIGAGVQMTVTMAETLTVDSPATYKQAAEIGKEIKRRQKAVKDYFAAEKEATHRAHKIICDKEKAWLDPLKAAEKAVKASMDEYTAKQEEARREAERAAQRAKEAEAAAMLEEAAALEAAGNADAAAAALQGAELMEAAPVVLETPTERVEGVSSRTGYSVTITDPAAVPVSVGGVEIRPIDMAALNRYVKATKGAVSIPGVRVEKIKKTALRA